MSYLLLTFIFIPTFLTQWFYFLKLKEVEFKCEQFLDNKTEEVIYSLRSEIPMGETFLRGALLEKIKVKAKNSVLNDFSKFKLEAKRSYQFKLLILIPWIFSLLTALLILAIFWSSQAI